jgi:ribose transport system ATP-binding protein
MDSGSPPHHNPPRLRMENITKALGGTQAVQGVSIEVEPGDVLGLIGENGAGKSTLMRILSGAIAPDSGQIFLDGLPFSPTNPMRARQAGIRMIYQELSLAPQLSITDNILLGSEPCMGPFIRQRSAEARVRAALELVGLSHLPPKTRVSQLSPPQQQLIEIARALSSDSDQRETNATCRVLVLDEPTSSLTRDDVERLFALIRKLSDRGVAIIYISHFLEELRSICKRYVVLRDGEVVGKGVVEGTTDHELVTLMIGRNVQQLYPRQPREKGELLLAIDALSGEKMPHSVDLRVHRGEIVGIFGLIGAGRTELIRTIFGLDPIRAGNIKVASNVVLPAGSNRWQRGIGMVSEDRKREGLALGLSITDNIVLPRLERFGPWYTVSPHAAARSAAPWLNRLRLKYRSASDLVQSLSGGNQQRVAIARLLHAEVDLFLLDEPTRGVDVGSKEEIYRLLDEITRETSSPLHKSCGILMVSSYLPELMGTCDRIAVMHRGHLSEPRSTADWNEAELLRAAMGQGIRKT